MTQVFVTTIKRELAECCRLAELCSLAGCYWFIGYYWISLVMFMWQALSIKPLLVGVEEKRESADCKHLLLKAA